MRPLVVAVIGSERLGGNTSIMVDYCRELLAEHDIDLEAIQLAHAQVTSCGPCGNCNYRDTPCGVEDDVPAIVRRMSKADGVIYAMPVHGFGTASLMQAFIERAGVGYLRFERPLANKVGGVLVVGRRYSHTEVVSQLNLNMLLNRMLLVGSGFPAVVQTENRVSPLDDHEGVNATRAMVSRMAEMIWLLKHHHENTGETLKITTVNERLT